MQLWAEDISLLETAYKYKILSLKQAWQASYKKVYSDATDCIGERIFPMVSEGLLQYTSDKFCGYRITLTNTGIEALREAKGLPKYTEDEFGNKKRTFRTPSQLRIREGLLPHQLSLNDYLLRADEILNLHKDISYEILLEKEVLQYDYFRPDGTIALKNKFGENMQIYVEQDMGTESRAQLLDKWDRYRRFIEYNKGDKELGKMVMLFVVGFDTTVKHPHGLSWNNMDEVIDFREKEVFKTITNLFPSILDQYFDIYVGTEETLLAVLKNKLIPWFKHERLFEEKVLNNYFKKQLNYRIFKAESLADSLDGSVFSYRMLSPKGDNFVIDDSLYTPLSVVAKAIHMERSNVFYLSINPDKQKFTNLIYTKEKDKLIRFMEYSGYKNVKDVLLIDNKGEYV